MSDPTKKHPDHPTARPDYRHTYPVFGLMTAAIAAALLVRWLAVPETFGDQGPYRAASLEQERAPEPRHVGQDRCAECHDETAGLHAKDTHAAVPCETCHGPGGAHAAAEGEAPMPKLKGKSSCLACHQYLPARPAAFPQVEWEKHYEFVGVADPETACTACHSPHEPLFLDRDLREARMHPLVHRCRDCHPGRDDEAMQRPEGHPAIFECNYCHSAVVKDFETRPHADRVRCTTCHLFIKDSDFSGRIVRDADPRFCLLCHSAGDFRREDAAPSVSWPGHREDMAAGPEDAEKRCVDCHQDRIHLMQSELTR